MLLGTYGIVWAGFKMVVILQAEEENKWWEWNGEDLSATESVASKITYWEFPMNCVCLIPATRLKIILGQGILSYL